MRLDVQPIDLLAHADLLLWTVEPLRAEGAATHPAASREALEELSARTGIAPDWNGARLKAFRDRFDLLLPEIRSAERTRLFEGDPVCPINETAYIRRDKGAILADLSGFYAAFGHRPRADAGEKPDHLLIEIEFVAVLLAMLARAIAADAEERIAVTADALAAFSNDHIGDWIESFCRRLAFAAEGSPFAAAAELLRAAWSSLAGRLALEPPVGGSSAVAEEDGGSPYECGMSPE